MTCRTVQVDGVTAIVCSRGQRPKKCTCCAQMSATLLCDWTVSSGTCDKAVCTRCATHVGPNRDLCRQHAIAWAERHAQPTGERTKEGE